MLLPPIPARWPRRRLTPEQESSDRALLANIQGNVVRAHGRSQVALVFFTLGPDAAANREALRGSLGLVTSAEQQRQDARRRKCALARGLPVNEAPFATLALSAAGLRACGVNDAFPPGADRTAMAFARGMAQDQSLLGDPPPGAWDEPFCSAVHGMWQLASESGDVRAGLLQQVGTWLKSCEGSITSVEGCFHWRPERGKPWECREPFGFADGISNPQFFADAPENHWSIDIGLDRVLIENEGIHQGGSFLVVRKLEQNVAAFRAYETKLAEALRDLMPAGQEHEAPHLAESVLIGRDREGRPLAELDAGRLNHFSFREDRTASRCPFHAHIRKANPRDDHPYAAGIASEDALKIQFVRRSFVYGDTAKLTLHGPEWPTGGVGLWFIGYMRDIEEQFREMQVRWMRDRNFPSRSADGLPDPLLYGGDNDIDPATTWAWQRDGKTACVPGLAQFVRPRGGEYFYVPSLRWLAAAGIPADWTAHLS